MVNAQLAEMLPLPYFSLHACTCHCRLPCLTDVNSWGQGPTLGTTCLGLQGFCIDLTRVAGNPEMTDRNVGIRWVMCSDEAVSAVAGTRRAYYIQMKKAKVD